MKAVVTGGGGFLGSRIARLLHERGNGVFALGRREYPQLSRDGINTVKADIRDLAALESTFAGADVVFHVAAMVGIWGPARAFEEVNIGGTRNVLEACKRCSVSSLVFTSSPSVVFGNAELCGVDEDQPYPRRYLAAYPRTKAEAERMVLAADGPGLRTTALRPHLIWGPGDPHLIPRVIDRARQRRLIQVGAGTNLVDVTYIDNAAEAHLMAADALGGAARNAGRAYFISQGEPVRLWPWLAGILEEAAAPPIRRKIGLGTAYAAGWAAEVVWRAARRPSEPPITRFLALQLGESHYFDISAARRDFGYEPRVSTEEGLRRMYAAWKRS